jgi:hypothetical protein
MFPLTPCQDGVGRLSTNCKIAILEELATLGGAWPARTYGVESGVVVVGFRRRNVIQSVFVFVRQREIRDLRKV